MKEKAPSEPANALIMPAFHSTAISTKLVQAMDDGRWTMDEVAGPVLVGLSRQVQVCSRRFRFLYRHHGDAGGFQSPENLRGIGRCTNSALIN